MTTHLDRTRRSSSSPARLALALALVAAGACGSKTKQPTTTVTAPAAPVKPRPPAAHAPEPQTATITPQPGGSETPSFPPIRFDFDSTALSADARDELQRLAGWMSGNRVRVTIEGHADERGTTEYNLALGQARAEAISTFLVRLGVDGARLQTISYGEERPAVAGSDETAWAANRRGELQPR